MIKILGVFNEITNTTIPIENFNLLSENKYEKHAFSYFTKKASAYEVIESFNVGSIDKLIAVGKLPLFKRIRVLYKLIKYEKYDIIHIHHTISSMLVILISFFLQSKSKLVFTVHNDYKHYKWFQKIIFRLVLNRVNYIICNSINTKKSISKICPQKNVSVIYNGVNTNNIPEPLNEKSKTIKLLFAGRLVPQKNILQLLQAIHKLSIDNYKFEFLLVGDGPQMNLVKDFVNNRNLNDHVKIFGKLKRNEVYDLMNLSDVFIVPSIFEGFCNAMVEAMLCKCIIVASNVQPLPEVTGGEQNAIFFELNESNHLFTILKNVLSNFDKYKSLATKSMIFAQSQYSLNNCANNHSYLYEKIS